MTTILTRTLIMLASCDASARQQASLHDLTTAARTRIRFEALEDYRALGLAYVQVLATGHEEEGFDL